MKDIKVVAFARGLPSANDDTVWTCIGPWRKADERAPPTGGGEGIKPLTEPVPVESASPRRAVAEAPI